jgi:hypothetical protein
MLAGEGKTSFILKRNNLWSYYIDENDGFINLKVNEPDGRTPVWCDRFELVGRHQLKMSFWSLIACRSVLIAPRFNQTFYTPNGRFTAPFHHTVVGLTRVWLFPWPRYSNTLYLWLDKETGDKVVPIAVAEYFGD